jgi:hypothetical protein
MNPLKKPSSFEEQLKKQLDGSEWKPSDALWDRIEQNIQANSFEPKLQEKLVDYAVSPSEEVWGKVAAQLPDSPKRKGLLWYGSFALMVLFSFGVGYWINQITSNSQNQLANSQNQLANSSPVNVNPNQQATSAQTDAAITLPASQANKAINKSKSTASQQELPPMQEQASSASKMGANNTAKSLAEPTPEAQYTERSVAQSNSQQVLGRTNKKTNKTSAKQASRNANKRAEGLAINAENQPENGSNLPPVKEVEPIKEIAGKSDLSMSIPIMGEQEIKAPLPQPKEILSSKNMSSAPADSFSGEQLFRGNVYTEPEEILTQFSITAMGGMHLTNMYLSMPNSNKYALDKSYALRKGMESSALDFSGAFMVDYHFGKSWMISTGIGITSFTQSVKFNVAPANQTNPDRVQPVNLYMHASDSIIAGAGNTLENKYSFTEVPIQLSYLFKSDGAFQFGLSAGLSYGRLNLVSAYITDPSCIGILLVNDKDAFPKFRDVFFANFSPSVAMRINPSVALGLMPQFKMSLNSMVDNPDWVQQRPSLIGLNVFLRKRF